MMDALYKATTTSQSLADLANVVHTSFSWKVHLYSAQFLIISGGGNIIFTTEND